MLAKYPSPSPSLEAFHPELYILELGKVESLTGGKIGGTRNERDGEGEFRNGREGKEGRKEGVPCHEPSSLLDGHRAATICLSSPLPSSPSSSYSLPRFYLHVEDGSRRTRTDMDGYVKEIGTMFRFSRTQVQCGKPFCNRNSASAWPIVVCTFLFRRRLLIRLESN